tara:strand:+ start:206 stop:472 length:267 start_codon:yes stop_codon:yes gene_type:complete
MNEHQKLHNLNIWENKIVLSEYQEKYLKHLINIAIIFKENGHPDYEHTSISDIHHFERANYEKELIEDYKQNTINIALDALIKSNNGE